MSSLGGSVLSLWNLMKTWQARANNAWGSSRSWNVGQSFETDRNAAYDSGVWGVGAFWSADAHGDPNVFANRFSAGVAQGHADIAGLTYLDGTPDRTTIPGSGLATNANRLAYITTTRAGYWAACGGYHTNSGTEGADHALYSDIRYAGASQGTMGFNRQAGSTQGGSMCLVGPAFVASGQLIELYGYKDFNLVAGIDIVRFRAWFMPTPGNYA